MFVEGRSQRGNGDAGRRVVASEPPNGGAPGSVSTLQRGGRRVVQEDAITIGERRLGFSAAGEPGSAQRLGISPSVTYAQPGGGWGHTPQPPAARSMDDFYRDDGSYDFAGAQREWQAKYNAKKQTYMRQPVAKRNATYGSDANRRAYEMWMR
jgi:hypothetical protein